MQIVNQLAAPLAQSATVARQQSSDKSDQVRRARPAQDHYPESDSYEHQVESTEEVAPIHDSTKSSPATTKNAANVPRPNRMSRRTSM